MSPKQKKGKTTAAVKLKSDLLCLAKKSAKPARKAAKKVDNAAINTVKSLFSWR